MYLRQFLKYWTLQIFTPDKLLRLKYEAFMELLGHDKKSLELITDLDEILHGGLQVDWAWVESLVRALRWSVGSLIRALLAMHPGAYEDLEDRFHRLQCSIMDAAALPRADCRPPYTLTLGEAAEAPELAGGKAHTLSRMLRETGFPGPRGFVVTTRAFYRFVQHNDLRHRLDELLARVRLTDWERLLELSGEMAAMIREGELPPEVREEISGRLSDYGSQGVPGPWALCSSALGENGEASFAGQYASVLGVDPEEVFPAYQGVLASKYSPRAVAYRLGNGLADQETPMAVLIQEMIDPAVSGVVYTREPESLRTAASCVAIYAVPGPGQHLVDGSTRSEVHYFTREETPRWLETVTKPPDPRTRAGEGRVFLVPEAALRLAKWGLVLEKTAGSPQEVEWCQDKQGRLFLLQSRPLKSGPVAGRGRIYQGEVEGLKKYAARVTAAPETPFSRRLRAMMAFITPLSLTEAGSAGFSPQECRSLHDVVRFAHEKGMAEMFSLVGRSGRGLGQARRLATDLPLVMYVLDLEGGLSPEAQEGKTIEPQLIACEPMRAWWEGLSHPEVVWHKGLMHLDWEELDRVSAGLVNLRGKALASYAIVSKSYLHLTLRFGYHFAVLDTLCGEEAEANYIAFRFKGGGGDFEKRLWRVRLIKTVLEGAGFVVKTRGDLLDARIERLEARHLYPRLTLLGLLHGNISLLDMALTGEAHAMSLAQAFQERYGRYVPDS